MPTEPEETPQPDEGSDEKPLCVCCLFPNDPLANFCVRCGAPMTPYAATGPFESLFAEGHVYRRAVEQPRKFIVVLGIWILFGSGAAAGAVLLFLGRDLGWPYVGAGAFIFPLSLVMIWKTTWNYFARQVAKPESQPPQ